MMGILAVVVLLVGGVVIGGRSRMDQTQSDSSLVRSWIALCLVIGLLVFTAAAMAFEDPTVRSTLIGAVAANAGAAIAFYFASKSSDQARQDILAATFGTEEVPDLTGMTAQEARERLGGSSLFLKVDPGHSKGTVDQQEPRVHTVVRKGSEVLVKLG